MQTSKLIKRILLLVLVAVFFFAGVAVFKYTLTGPTINKVFNDRVAEIEARGENIDMLFVGGSRTYRSFDPTIFDEVLGIKNSTNTGTPSQRSILNYYILKQFLEKHTPKYVILGASYNGLVYEQSPHTFLLGVDRLSLPNQIACAIASYGFNKGLLTLTGKSEYAADLYADRVMYNIREKARIAETKNEDDIFKIQANGYLGSYKTLPLGGISYKYSKTSSVSGTDQIDAKAFKYFDKCVQLCKEKGVEVILMSGPCSLMQVYSVDGYQEFVDYYEDYADKNGIEYYNLNYLKGREETFTDDMFMDFLHVNYNGGQKISRIFANIIKERSQGKDVEKYFYSNLDELKKDVHRIPACTCKYETEGSNTVVYTKSLHNDNITPEYRVLASVDGKHFEELSGWTKNSKFSYPSTDLAGYSVIKTEARTGVNPGELVAYSIIELK